MGEFVKIVELHDCLTPDSIQYDKNGKVVESDGDNIQFLNSRHKGTIWKCSCDKRWVWSGTTWREDSTGYMGISNQITGSNFGNQMIDPQSPWYIGSKGI
jgi:hypothetical protein